jgi:hypothetical protein
MVDGDVKRRVEQRCRSYFPLVLGFFLSCIEGLAAYGDTGKSLCVFRKETHFYTHQKPGSLKHHKIGTAFLYPVLLEKFAPSFNRLF